jgi:hypothetical protein
VAERQRPTLPPQDAPPWVAWVWYAAAALAVLGSSFAVVFNGDLWFHLAAGRWIVQHGAAPVVDGWSYTAAGRPWLDHEWLAQAIFQGWAQAFGLESLIVWKLLLLAATFLLLFRVLRRLGAGFGASFVILLFTLRVAMVFFEIRPHLWSLLFTVVVLQAALLREGPRWLLPAVFALWANLHGGVVFGLALLWALLAVQALLPDADRERQVPWWRRTGRLAATALACLAAALLNPYGTAALTYPFRLVSASAASRELLTEWRSPFAAGGLGAPLFPWAIGAAAAAALLLLATSAWRARRRESAGALAATALTLAMAIASRRFIPLFAIAASLVLALASDPLARWLAGARGRGPLLSWWPRTGSDPRPAQAAAALPAGSEGSEGAGGGALLAPAAAASRRSARVAASAPLTSFAPLAALAARAPVASLAPVAAMAAAGLLLVLPHRPPPAPFRATTMSYFLPVDTLDFVAANRLSGKVFAFYPWGGYVDWRTAGDLQVFVDSRADTLFDDATERAYSLVQNQEPGWEDVLEDSGAQWVLWPRRGADGGALVRRLSLSGRWLRVHQDAVSVLLARREMRLPAPLVPPAEGPFRDWAAAQDAYALRQLPAAERLLVRALDAMPDLGPACEDLIHVEQWLGPAAAARGRIDGCRELVRREAPAS